MYDILGAFVNNHLDRAQTTDKAQERVESFERNLDAGHLLKEVSKEDLSKLFLLPNAQEQAALLAPFKGQDGKDVQIVNGKTVIADGNGIGFSDMQSAHAVAAAEQAIKAGMSAGEVANAIKGYGVDAQRADRVAADASWQASTRAQLEESKPDDPHKKVAEAGQALG